MKKNVCSIAFVLMCTSAFSQTKQLPKKFEVYSAGYNQNGIKNSAGNIIIPAQYESVQICNNGLFLVKNFGSYGLFDTTGNPIVPLNKYHVISDFSCGLARISVVRNYHNYTGYIDKLGKEIIEPKYDSWLHDDENGFGSNLVALGLGGKWGFLDSTGKEVIPFMYEETFSFIEGRARVKLNGMYGFVDSTGKVVISIKYASCHGAFHEGLVAAKLEKDGKYGYLDKNGNVVIPFDFDSCDGFAGGKALVSINGENWVINKTGKKISKGN